MDQTSLLSASVNPNNTTPVTIESGGDTRVTRLSVHDDVQGTSENTQIGFPSSEATTASAQSQVLNNLDILSNVFAFFYVPQPGTNPPSRIPFPDSQHLLWASLTSRVFFDPAMTILWRSIDSWLPLLRLISVLRREENIYNMHGLVKEQDFQRLDLYGRRIRRLDMGPMNRAVSPYIYTYIQLHHSYLFPALRELIIPNIDRIGILDLPGLFLTVAPPLSELSLGGIVPSVESIAGSILQSVCMKAKGLCRLVLSGQFTATSLNIVTQFSKLETLEIYGRGTDLPSDTLKKLSELVSLKSLKIALDDSSIFTPPSTNIPSFEALHNLTISASAARVLVILCRITVHHLRTIRVHFTSLGPGASQECPGKCVETISRMTMASKSLKTITVTSDAPFVRVPAEELVHLKERTKVAHIDIVVDLALAKALRSLVSADGWNSIQTLILRSGLAPGQEGGTTISISIWLLSLHFFPNVKHLTISVIFSLNQSDIDGWRRGVLQYPPECHNLQDLVFLPVESCPEPHCSNQTVENASIFAQVIHHSCPHLRTFDLSKITYINPDWRKGVEHMVRGLQKATNNVHVCQNSDNSL